MNNWNDIEYRKKRAEWLKKRLCNDSPQSKLINNAVVNQTFELEEEKEYCECEKPQRCNKETGIIGYIGSDILKDGLPVAECNICHKCGKFIDKNFKAIKHEDFRVQPLSTPSLPSKLDFKQMTLEEVVDFMDKVKVGDLARALCYISEIKEFCDKLVDYLKASEQ